MLLLQTRVFNANVCNVRHYCYCESELLSIYHFSFCFNFRVSVFFFFLRLLSFILWCSRSVVFLSLPRNSPILTRVATIVLFVDEKFLKLQNLSFLKLDFVRVKERARFKAISKENKQTICNFTVLFILINF